MISYQTVFQEIERQLNNARHANHDNAMREALAAIRSLTEVALNGNGDKRENIVPKRMEMPQIQSVQPVQSLSSLEGKPLEEDGANGDSLFDF